MALLPPRNLVEVLRDKARLSDLLGDTGLVPRTLRIVSSNLHDLHHDIATTFGYPCWVRSAHGSSGLGSLRVTSPEQLDAWLRVNRDISELIVSEYLPGRNLACKLLYKQGELLVGACGERVSYIMSKVSPSGITGNTSFGRLINDLKVAEVAIEALTTVCRKLNVEPHGFFTVDLKEDTEGRPYVTEINVRHVAFTEAFAAGGVNLAEYTVLAALDQEKRIEQRGIFRFPEGLIFLRDVDGEPIVMKENELLKQ